jgi:hypothetical protein
MPAHACRLTAVHLACIYIAAKNVEYVPYKKLLSTMLAHVHNREVGASAAADLELEVQRRSLPPSSPLLRTSPARTLRTCIVAV